MSEISLKPNKVSNPGRKPAHVHIGGSMEEDKIYWCQNCDLEFDPFAKDVKIVHTSSHGIMTIEDASRRAHSLRLTTWKKIQRVRELEDSARPISPFNLYQAQDIEIEPDESEVETDEIQGEPENDRNQSTRND
jgi:hypothetical protein